MNRFTNGDLRQKRTINGALTLRTKLLLLILAVACTLVITLIVLGLDAIHQTSRTAQEVSARALELQAQDHMIKVTQENAARNSLILDRTMGASGLLAAAASELLFSGGALCRYRRGAGCS